MLSRSKRTKRRCTSRTLICDGQRWDPPLLSASPWTGGLWPQPGGQGVRRISLAPAPPHTAPIRDSKLPRGPVIDFADHSWAFFVPAVQQGELCGS
ncbi:DUF397 domain-containing protein [Streptomyces sp. NRRL B-3229]|uniref:DUF397 domain-containing protein n=1 Tax=Streptomyces sp. NRRL B-3229 TaxID=1463836 RepID=UPI001F2A328C|nr:DUF397 domain-containing protein [Streptomyces sp. NRRL B-3229]